MGRRVFVETRRNARGNGHTSTASDSTETQAAILKSNNASAGARNALRVVRIKSAGSFMIFWRATELELSRVIYS